MAVIEKTMHRLDDEKRAAQVRTSFIDLTWPRHFNGICVAIGPALLRSTPSRLRREIGHVGENVKQLPVSRSIGLRRPVSTYVYVLKNALLHGSHSNSVQNLPTDKTPRPIISPLYLFSQGKFSHCTYYVTLRSTWKQYPTLYLWSIHSMVREMSNIKFLYHLQLNYAQG